MFMLEESIRLAAKAYVFEPNISTTWVTIRSMIDNFLTGVWKQGGLAGAVPAYAFSVHVGLAAQSRRSHGLRVSGSRCVGSDRGQSA
jgi:phage tail sheath protein FI